MASALVLVLKREFWAWVVFFVGLGFVVNPYVQDYWYGKERPSREELNRMPADKYKQRLSDPKFKRWADRMGRKSKDKPFF